MFLHHTKKEKGFYYHAEELRYEEKIQFMKSAAFQNSALLEIKMK